MWVSGAHLVVSVSRAEAGAHLVAGEGNRGVGFFSHDARFTSLVVLLGMWHSVVGLRMLGLCVAPGALFHRSAQGWMVSDSARASFISGYFIALCPGAGHAPQADARVDARPHAMVFWDMVTRCRDGHWMRS